MQISKSEHFPMAISLFGAILFHVVILMPPGTDLAAVFSRQIPVGDSKERILPGTLAVRFEAQNQSKRKETVAAKQTDVTGLNSAIQNSIQYPAIAIRKGWHGKVRIKVEVNGTGQASSFRLVGSSGFSLLDNTAIAAIKSWQFPTENHNSSFELRFQFQLN